MSDDDKAEVARLRERLKQMLARTPNHSRWSTGTALNYKDAYAKAKKVLDKKSASAQELVTQLNTMEVYYRA